MDSVTSLYYRDVAGNLQTITYGCSDYDTYCVSDQGALVGDIVEMGLPTPVSPVLCCIQGK